jgi:hypothetical protein
MGGKMLFPKGLKWENALPEGPITKIFLHSREENPQKQRSSGEVWFLNGQGRFGF